MNPTQHDQTIAFLTTNTKCSAHDVDHALRVLATSTSLHSHYPTSSLPAIEFAALLHDAFDHKFGFSDEDRKVKIGEFLTSIGVPAEISAKVIEIVNEISFSKGQIPSSLEGKIVQDADRLDAIGAVGAARCFAFGGSQNRAIYRENDAMSSIQHFYDKLLKLDGLMNLEESKVRSQQRTQFLQRFLDQFLDEIKGVK